MSNTIMPKISKYSYKKDLAFREYPLIINPTGGEKTYNPGDVVSFRVALGNDKLRCIYGPATYGTYEITITNTSGGNATCNLDTNANCVFSRITSNSNGGILEDFNKTNIYIPVVFDMIVSPFSRINYWTTFGNYDLCQPDLITYTAGVAAANAVSVVGVIQTPVIAAGDSVSDILRLVANSIAANDRYSATSIRNGYKFGTIANNGTAVACFAFILPSVIGQFSRKLFPVSEIAGSNFDIDLLTDTAANALISSALNVTYALKRLRLNLCVVEYNSTLTEVLRRAYNSSYVIPCNSIQYFSQNIVTSTANQNFSWSINATLQNAKGIMFAFIDADNTVYNLPTLSGRTSLGLTQAQLSIGGYTLPSNRYMTYDGSTAMATQLIHPNFFLSALKYFGNNIDTDVRCSTNIKQFNTGGATANGTFVLCFNLEGLHENDDEFRSCAPLDGNTTTLTFTTGVASAGNTTIHCFIMYEFDVVIQQGTALVTNKYNDFSNNMMK